MISDLFCPIDLVSGSQDIVAGARHSWDWSRDSHFVFEHMC